MLTSWVALVLASLVAGTLTGGPQSVPPFMILFIALGWAAVFAFGYVLGWVVDAVLLWRRGLGKGPAMNILRERYARGEIGPDEFARMLLDLHDS